SCTLHLYFLVLFFFFNDTATTEIYTLSLHDALPISQRAQLEANNLKRKGEAQEIGVKLEGLTVVLIRQAGESGQLYGSVMARDIDRKSTRLNSSHVAISYAVFCLKKKKNKKKNKE